MRPDGAVERALEAGEQLVAVFPGAGLLLAGAEALVDAGEDRMPNPLRNSNLRLSPHREKGMPILGPGDTREAPGRRPRRPEAPARDRRGARGRLRPDLPVGSTGLGAASRAARRTRPARLRRPGLRPRPVPDH